ncbi:phospholipase D-like domain-containing protein [Sporosarcina sp. Te-1]|uniref:phospholipase D-like domain-containing protein n=1 Tax=Sporosarcina sp. Te-1 TaxID=2818390 RepID=UPI001A9D4D1B|nr:phospholipase D-like domain-containing protein [Sporosarcina sp. Te-1]QTD40669.1 phospholipase [Sporosarcina sp. Te-1]
MKGWKKRSKGKWLSLVMILLFVLLYIAVIAWHTYKPLPKGIPYEGELHRTDDVEMFTDLTYAQNKKGDGMVHELSIFDEVYKMIDEAKSFIVLDFFLMDHYSDEKVDFPKIAETLTAKLIQKKQENPDMDIVFITDPLNTGYGSYDSKWFTKLEEAGIEVVYSDLDKLRDSTPIYSGLYRTIFRWIHVEKKGWIPNAMASKAPKMTLASYMKLLNVKANHRKTMVTDKAALVTSGNPHDASGFHGNVALKVSGAVINDILESEEAVVRYTNGGSLPRADVRESKEGQYRVQYVTEKKILDALLEDMSRAEQGDRIRMGMFFVAMPEVVQAIEDAVDCGVEVQMILDPNENSFGNEKSGLPNRPVMQKMMDETKDRMEVRWYNTVIGQYHTKLVVVETQKGTFITNGSANLTDRTLDNYNLEGNLRVIAPNDSPLVREMNAYFDRLWNNEDALYTLDFEEYQNEFTFFQRGIYRLQELLKLTTY